MMQRNSTWMMLLLNILCAVGWLTAAVMTRLRHPEKGFMLPALYAALACYYCVRTTSKLKMFQQERAKR
jgi:hypothetical protein